MSKKGFMRLKSYRRSHRALKIKTDRMRYKIGQKKIDSSRNVLWIGEQVNLITRKKTEKTEQKKAESIERKQKKKQESGRKPTWAKSEKRELTRKREGKSKLMRQERTERIQCIKNHENIRTWP